MPQYFSGLFEEDEDDKKKKQQRDVDSTVVSDTRDQGNNLQKKDYFSGLFEEDGKKEDVYSKLNNPVPQPKRKPEEPKKAGILDQIGNFLSGSGAVDEVKRKAQIAGIGAKNIPEGWKLTTGTILNRLVKDARKKQSESPLETTARVGVAAWQGLINPTERLAQATGMKPGMLQEITRFIPESVLKEAEKKEQELKKSALENSRKNQAERNKLGKRDGFSGFMEDVAYSAPSLVSSVGITAVSTALTKNPALGLMLGFGDTYSQNALGIYVEAKEYGVKDQEAEDLAIKGGMIIGAIDMTPVGKLLNRSPQGAILKKSLMRNTVKAVTGVGTQGIFEGGTESVQQVISNVLAQTYNENKELLEGVKEAFLVGGTLGSGAEVVAQGVDAVTPQQVLGDSIDKLKEAVEKPANKRTPEEQELVDTLQDQEDEFAAAEGDATLASGDGSDPSETPNLATSSSDNTGELSSSINEEAGKSSAGTNEDPSLTSISGNSPSSQTSLKTLSSKRTNFISRFNSNSPSSSDYTTYYDEMQKQQPALFKGLKAVMDETQGDVAYRLKALESLTKKIGRKGKPLGEMNDTLAATITVSDEKSVYTALESLKKHTAVTKIDDFRAKPTFLGYKAIHVDVQLENGAIAEVQLNTKDGLYQKHWAHEIYEKWRSYIEDNGGATYKEIREKIYKDDPEMVKQFVADVQLSRDIYEGKVPVPQEKIASMDKIFEKSRKTVEEGSKQQPTVESDEEIQAKINALHPHQYPFVPASESPTGKALSGVEAYKFRNKKQEPVTRTFDVKGNETTNKKKGRVLNNKETQYLQDVIEEKLSVIRSTANDPDSLTKEYDDLYKEITERAKGDRIVLSAFRTQLNKEMFGLAGASSDGGRSYASQYAQVMSMMNDPEMGGVLSNLFDKINELDGRLLAEGQAAPDPVVAQGERPQRKRSTPQSEYRGAQEPVGTGRRRESRAYKRVRDRIEEEAQMDVSYNKLNLDKDAENAMNFVEANPARALRVAMGLEAPPLGMTERGINIAMAERALREKDSVTVSQVEASGSLRQTRRGQEIVVDRGRFNENSPHRLMAEVLERRMERAGRTLITEAKSTFTKQTMSSKEKTIAKIDERVKKIKKGLTQEEKATMMKLDVQNFINNLTCK